MIAKAIMRISALWCHFWQCLWEIGQKGEEVGFTQMVKGHGLTLKSPQLEQCGLFLLL